MNGFLQAILLIAVIIWAFSPTEHFVGNCARAIQGAVGLVALFAIVIVGSLVYVNMVEKPLPPRAKWRSAPLATSAPVAKPAVVPIAAPRPQPYEILVTCDYSCALSAAIACRGWPRWVILSYLPDHTDRPLWAQVRCSGR